MVCTTLAENTKTLMIVIFIGNKNLKTSLQHLGNDRIYLKVRATPIHWGAS